MKRRWAQVALCLLVPFAALAVLAPMRWSAWRTLASLRKVDDHPLYVMRYYGDYDVDGLPEARSSGAEDRRASRLCSAQEWACTCLASLSKAGERLLGRNFDWHDHPALLLFTDPPDRQASVSMVDISYLGFGSQTPSLRERSRLLSAVHLPFDGMNECGLAVGMMAVPEASSGYHPEKMTISDLGAIRLLLDYACDVEQAVALLDDHNVVFSGPFLHYMVADAAGDSAVIEFVDGDMRVLRADRPWQVATNFVISESMPDDGNSTCWRYNTAYRVLEGVVGSLTAEDAMGLLESVSQSNTIWSVVYGIGTGDVQVAMGREYGQVYRFSLGRSRL
jgi:hypothetical protein